MRLSITIKKAPSGCPEMNGKRFVWDDRNFITLGRALDNDLVLPDPENFVSSHHGKIEFSNGLVTVHDQSVNGLYINQNDKPLGGGNQAPLTTGTQLIAGNYRLAVELSEVVTAAHGPAGAAARLQAEPIPDDRHSNVSQEDVAVELAKQLGLSGMTESQLRAMPSEVTALIKRSVGSLMDVLSARRQVKSALNMENTVIQGSRNNPLKVSANTEDALERMFGNPSEAYLDPEQALVEAFEDIGDHQVAIMAASLQVYQQVVDRFEPDAIEQSLLNMGAGGGVFPGKGKLWDDYKQHYEAIAANGTENVRDAFLHEFSAAYREHLRKLKKGRSK